MYQPSARDLRASPAFYVTRLNGMRAFAFLFVFFAHAQPFKMLPGRFGVTVFFFLGGYLITSLVREEADKTGTISLKGFYFRRRLRIFPPCCLTIILVSGLATAGILYNWESYASLVSAFLYFSNYWNILGVGKPPNRLGHSVVAGGRRAGLSAFPPFVYMVRATVHGPQAAGCAADCVMYRSSGVALLSRI